MNSQNDEFSEVTTEIDEGIFSDGVRTPVKFAEKSIEDDLDDYVYMSPVRKKKGKKHSSHGRKKKMKTYKKVIIAILSTILALVVLFVGTLTYLIYSGSRQMLDNVNIINAPEGITVQNEGQLVVYDGQTYELNENITSILFMGVDREQLPEEGEITSTGAGQADVLILMTVDTESGKTTLINISRDTMTDIAVYSAGGTYLETRNEQLCLAYAYGDGRELSCENVVTAVQRLFYNIPINSYLALDLEGISAINDSIGGVDVVSPETIGNFTEGESYHLEGDMAESFVRTRNTTSLDANVGRMKRQQAYLDSFISSLIGQTKEDIMTPVNLFNMASPYICTNLNPSKVSFLAQNVLSHGGLTIETNTVPGEIKQGEVYAEFYINEDEFYPIFLNVFYNKI